MKLLLLCVFVCCLSFSNVNCKKEWYSIDDELNITSGKNNSGCIGYGYFRDEINKDGWGKLYIKMNNELPSQKTNNYFGAGYLESALTWRYIYNFSQNYFINQFNTSNVKELPIELLDFANTNQNWMLSTFSETSSPSPSSSSPEGFNNQVNNVIEQFNGVVQGYSDQTSSGNNSQYELDPILLLLMNYIGDLDDILNYIQYQNNSKEFSEKEFSRLEIEEILSKGKCSSLIKLPSDYSELYSSHTTWGSYWSMMRIFKRIIIPDINAPNGYDMYYSGYPGILTSDDDYFLMKPSNLMVTETTNQVINMSLYEGVKPQTLLYWVRSLVANRLSNSGQEWIDNFIPYQSGTYCNQWIIVDYKLFTPFQDLKNGTLMILESIPGEYLSADVTNVLSYGYWPSYNRPYFQRFQDLMGYTYYESLYGDIMSYSLNPRAKIFRRDQNNVQSLSDMQSIMLENQYLTDPYSEGYPGNAIASRYDLGGGPINPPEWFFKTARGAIDSKITSSALISIQQSFAYSGPTVTSDCPPFNFENGWMNVSHIGLPQIYNFDWVLMDLDDH